MVHNLFDQFHWFTFPPRQRRAGCHPAGHVVAVAVAVAVPLFHSLRLAAGNEFVPFLAQNFRSVALQRTAAVLLGNAVALARGAWVGRRAFTHVFQRLQRPRPWIDE